MQRRLEGVILPGPRKVQLYFLIAVLLVHKVLFYSVIAG